MPNQGAGAAATQQNCLPPIKLNRNARRQNEKMMMAQTEKDHEQIRNALLDPAPMTIDEALASPKPIGNIFLRLAHARSRAPSEQMFWDAAYFLTDAENGGLHQAMTNSTSDAFESIQRFADIYCGVSVAKIFRNIAALFPDGHVPADRDQRTALIFAMSADENGEFEELTEENDPFCELTDDFYRNAENYNAGLIALVNRNLDDFPCLGRSKDAGGCT